MMLDDLRDQEQNPAFFPDDDEEFLSEIIEDDNTDGVRPLANRFLGMTASQRLMLSAMLLVEVVIIGVMLLAITGKFLP